MKNEPRPWIKAYDDLVDPDLPLPEASFVDLMEQVFRDFRDRPAFHFMGRTATFADLDSASSRFAAFLRKMGLQKGDVVGVNLPNIPQYLIALLGTLRAGCAQSGVSPLLTGKEIAGQLRDCGARVLVTLDALYEHRLMEAIDEMPAVSHVVFTNLGDEMPMVKRVLGRLLKKVPSGRVAPAAGKELVSFGQIIKGPPLGGPGIEIRPEDICLIQYTGGTTGKPKGAELTHRNVVAATTHFQQWCNLEPGIDVFLTGFPLFHIGGLFSGMAFLMNACPQVLIPDPRNTGHIVKEMAKHRPTGIGNVPSLYQMLLAEPGFRKLSFSHVKGLVSGAAPFSPETLKELEALVGEGKVADIYGMTETCATISMSPFYGKKKPGTVGLPMQNTMVKLADLESGSRPAAPGAPGEIIVRGPQVMKGYKNNPEETAKAMRDFEGETWFFTGDIGVFDEDGYLKIVDRSKDMINVSGYKVFSSEVEEKILAHPAVEFCALIGAPDPARRGSEQVKAVIQLKAEFQGRDRAELERDIIGYCKKNMAAYKVPRIVSFIEAIPLTTVGKVDKKALRN